MRSEPKTRRTRRTNPRQARAEEEAVKNFNAELQKEINRVDWANVKPPRQRC
jgi:hypothetical protein